MSERDAPAEPAAPRRVLVVDAHEDLAYNALTYARDYGQSALAIRRAEVNSDAPRRTGRALLGLPEWLAGSVAVVFGTLFVTPARRQEHVEDIQIYRDADEAYRRAGLQLDYYRRFVEDHEQVRLIATRADLEAVLASWQGDDPAARRVGLVPLMEGADPIREPREVEEWYERGVRVVGLAWAATRYAGGTGEPGPLTALGHELLEAAAPLRMIIDLSHSAEETYSQVLDRYPGQLIASHSNPRVLGGDWWPDRHLTDGMIERLAERGGVIGILPLNNWLRPGIARGDPKEKVTLEHLAAAIDHVCQLVGDAQHVGLGTDFDGGFGVDRVPAEIDTVADLVKLVPALAAHGYAPADVEAVMGGNWLRVLRGSLP